MKLRSTRREQHVDQTQQESNGDRQTLTENDEDPAEIFNQQQACARAIQDRITAQGANKERNSAPHLRNKPETTFSQLGISPIIYIM